MQTLKLSLALASLLFFIGCSQDSPSPVAPSDQSSASGLAKSGPVVHQVVGSGLLFSNGKNCGARYALRQNADGSFDGDYEINCANASGDPTFKLNGGVISFAVYENVNAAGGKMGVIFGQEKTGPYAGWYDVFFAIDNGQPGQSTTPDQVNFYLLSLPTLTYEFWGMTIEEWAALSPADLMANLGVADCDQGNITVN
jgi:hypothetical protein